MSNKGVTHTSVREKRDKRKIWYKVATILKSKEVIVSIKIVDHEYILRKHNKLTNMSNFGII